MKPGFLHTYTTKHPLSLLYIDGMSAGKSSKGTLDSQDYLLLNGTSSPDEPFGGEYERATKLCEMARTQWDNKIDGILRMEAGFEIILCEFEKHLDLTESIRAGSTPSGGGPGAVGGDLSWLWAIVQRYHGIGGGRVMINYDDFVTAYAYDFNLFGDDEPLQLSLPRLQNISTSSLEIVRRDIDALVQRSATTKINSVDWQAKADMIVTRYSNLIQQLLSMQNLTSLQTEVSRSLRPFINIDDRNATTELERCTHQFLPYLSSISPSVSSSNRLPLSYTSLLTVSSKICGTLSSLLPPSSQQTASLKSSHTALQNLKAYLRWSSFADCPVKCAYDEICFIPIWPMGSKEQRATGHGACIGVNSPMGDNDYWRDGRGRGPGHGPGP